MPITPETTRFAGKHVSTSDFAKVASKITKIHPVTIKQRVARGWSAEQAAIIPPSGTWTFITAPLYKFSSREQQLLNKINEKMPSPKEKKLKKGREMIVPVVAAVQQNDNEVWIKIQLVKAD